ncbi:MAG TPA: hypothetical protein VGR12_04230, partial [Solirubrobacteraceae bacterium]|nr:hypothetical protein [Solirubrobacteraceae bacterium]
MTLRRIALAVAGGACALAPAAPAHAIGPITNKPENIDPIIRLAKRAHDEARDRNVRLHRVNAELRGDAADRRRHAKLRDWSVRHLRAVNERLEERNRK